jgi:transcriptional regulator with XRE-family HTH domain
MRHVGISLGEDARANRLVAMALLRATDDDLASLIGSSIRSARLAARWTQAELARRLGTTQSAVSRLETGAVSCLDIRLASAAFRLLGIRLSVDASTLGLVGRRQQGDFVHARCAGYVGGRLRDARWEGDRLTSVPSRHTRSSGRACTTGAACRCGAPTRCTPVGATGSLGGRRRKH